MSFVNVALRKMRSGLMAYGPSSIKRFLWDREYSADKWHFAYHSAGDCVYQHLEKYAAGGSILDLGCGMGNTATELAMNAYHDYTGVDISEACLKKAEDRTQQCGRSAKNRFVRGDFLSFAPGQKYDVILFRESMYHVPPKKIKSVLDHYAGHLKAGGVFIVRMGTLGPDGQRIPRPWMMFNLIRSEFEVVEDCDHEAFKSTVIVFRPKGAALPAKNALAGEAGS
jgi:2-polyprenyl-3-methyl-5-hydroxy-6-metoxy-1,4-benzoquinol methylase